MGGHKHFGDRSGIGELDVFGYRLKHSLMRHDFFSHCAARHYAHDRVTDRPSFYF
jgi:hypothetical protein